MARPVVWSGYSIYDPGLTGLPEEAPRREARAAYQRLMSERHGRISQLIELAQANGVPLDVDGNGLDELGEWFVNSVEEDPDRPGRLRGRWYSVVNDIGLLLGELAIERSEGKLRWEFYIWGRRNTAYHRHVIMGFDTPDTKYNVDLDFLVAAYGHRSLMGRLKEPPKFSMHVESMVRKAADWRSA